MALTSIGKDFTTRNGVVIEGTGTVTSSTAQVGALQVNGGAAIAANLIVGTTATIYGPTTLYGTLTANQSVTLNSSLSVTGASIFASITATNITGTTLVISGTSNIGGIAQFTNATNPTGSNNGTGALQVTNGGAAIAGQLWVGGTTYLAGDLYVDGTQFVVNNQTISTGDKTLTLSSGSTSAGLAAGSGIQIGSTATAAAYATFLYDGGTTPGYWYTANGLKVNATTGANSTNSGALQVAGGVGVAGGIFVSGAVTASNFIGYLGGPSTGAIGSGSNLYGGGPTQIVYQSGINQTSYTSSGTNGQLLYLTGGVPTWTSPSGLSAGSATTSTNLAGGLTNQIPYQTSPGQTTFNAGLVYNGTTFTTTNIQVTSNNNATAATGNSGALMVTGGAGISQDLWVGGNINVNGSIFLKGVGLDTISGTTGTFVNVAVTGTGYALTVPNGSVSIGNNLTATTAVITSGNASTSSLANNALYVQGGIGIGKTLTVGSDTWIAGNLNVVGSITGTNVVINNLTGTNAQFYGDATGNGALYAGVVGYTPFGQTMFQATGNYNGYMEINVQNINTGTQSSGDVVVSADNATLAGAYIDMGITNSNWDGTQPNSLGYTLSPNDGYVMVGQNVTPGDGDLVFGTTTSGTNIKFVVAASSATVLANQLAMSVGPVGSTARSTTTGVLVVYGGVGIGGGVYIGGTVTATNAVINGTTNASSTTTGALQVAGGVGIGGGVYVGGVVTATSFYGNLTGIVTTATLAYNATTATNLAGGATGSLPYQSRPGLTSFIPITSNVGWVLTSNGTTATWTDPATALVNNATTATNIAGFSAQQVLFQFTPGITTATSGLTFSLNNNQLGAANLLVAGITTSSGQLVANSGVISNGTNSGALIVTGGAGVSGSINAGGIVYAGLQSAATGAPIYTFSGGNTTFATYTSSVLTGTGQVTLDSWSTSSYRTARYVIQIVDSGKIHVTEMTVFTDWTNVYMNQYGISTNQGELGTFDANLTSVAGSVTLTFSPSPAASAMTIKISRLGITT